MQYDPSTICDCIEVMIRDAMSIKGVDHRKYHGHIIECIAKYDRASMAAKDGGRKIPEYVSAIMRYGAVGCLDVLMKKYHDVTSEYFWDLYDGQDGRLYDVMCRHESYLSADWLRRKSVSDIGAVRNVVGWMPHVGIVSSVHLLANHAHIVAEMRNMRDLIVEMIFFPSKAMDILICKCMEIMHGEKADEFLEKAIEAQVSAYDKIIPEMDDTYSMHRIVQKIVDRKR